LEITNYFDVFFFTMVEAAACFLRNLSRFLALLLISDPLAPLELELFVLLPLLDLPDFKLVPCRRSFDFPDEVLDLTTPALLLVNIAEEELFPDFSVLGSFNFSAPSASLLFVHFIQFQISLGSLASSLLTGGSWHI